MMCNFSSKISWRDYSLSTEFFILCYPMSTCQRSIDHICVHLPLKMHFFSGSFFFPHHHKSTILFYLFLSLYLFYTVYSARSRSFYADYMEFSLHAIMHHVNGHNLTFFFFFKLHAFSFSLLTTFSGVNRCSGKQ